MAEDVLIKDEQFWSSLKIILEAKYPCEISSLAKKSSLKVSELHFYLNFIREIGVGVELIENDDKKLVSLTNTDASFKLEFSLYEWLGFQAHFQVMINDKNKVINDVIRNKLASAEYKYRDYDLFSPLQTLQEVIGQHEGSLLESVGSSTGGILEFLEESVVAKRSISLKTSQGNLRVYPYKIAYIDGGLNLIVEELTDKCLSSVYLNDIISFYELEENYHPSYSIMEVEDFISSMRAMSENQVRLVLKIYSTECFSLKFNKMFLEKPCLFTNPEGDFIWAATLEPSQEIFEWLTELGESVEILDPVNFKVKFLRYCEDKLKKIA